MPHGPQAQAAAQCCTPRAQARSAERNSSAWSLADEKDMVYIIAYADEKAAIMRAINENAGPGTKAGAICFSLPVSSVAGLRERTRNSKINNKGHAAK